MSKYDPLSWFTEEGNNALKDRIISFIDLFNNHEFPFHAKMFGFNDIFIDSKEDCFSRIKELVELTGNKIKIYNCLAKNTDGSEQSKTSILLLEKEVEKDGC